ncbi:MAG: bifunctional allantoicase/(S)-ureidoglycine aminohydrolase [Pseudomonadota bacterium]
MSYQVPAPGGLPGQRELMTGRACFTEAYAVMPHGVMRDIVASFLPHWASARFWVLARPLSGFAETFSQYLCELAPGGGSDQPESDANAQAVLFVTEGSLQLSLAEQSHSLRPGSFVFLPAGLAWTLHNRDTDEPARFHWIRKAWQPVDGVEAPPAMVAHESDVTPIDMPGTQGTWSTTRFIDPDDMRYDFHVNIVNFEAGGCIPFEETHVMEHGLFVLEGKATYKLNTDWHEVEAGDFLWLRAFCPQACYAAGPGRFRYLLYKDVNRHAPLSVTAR